MKKTLTIALIAVAGAALAYGVAVLEHRRGVVDPQVAGGEWKIEIQTPPCDSVKNLQVIWPERSGEPMTVECDSMPVAEK